jgi:protoporphyrinogen oxidase
MNRYDVIVVGGGVSGLVFAEHTARAGKRVLLLEKAPAVGGCLDSWQAAPDYYVEMGAHTAYNSYGDLLEILQRRGRLGELLGREKLGYHFVNQGGLQSPLARLNWLELLTSLPVGLFKDKSGLSVRAYYGALLGRGNYANVLGPAFAAVLSQPCDEYPAQWLFRRKPRLKDAPRKYTWATGMQGLLQALTVGAGFETRTGMTVTSVARADAGYTLTAGEETFSCAILALATPPDVAATLLADAAPGTARRLMRFPMADIESVAVTLRRDRTRLKPVAGLIGVDDAFYSVVTRDPVPHPELRAFTFHFRPGRHDDAAKHRRMAQVLGCSEDDFQSQHARVNRLPALDVSHMGLVAELEDDCAESGLALLGNYFQGMSIGDCAQRSALEARRLFAKGA